jgi:hypothetical protein
MAPQNRVLLSTITVGLITIPPYLHLPLSFKVLIDAVKYISKSKYRQNSGQKTNNDIYKILHRKLRIEKHSLHTRNGCELNCPGRVSSSYSTGIKVS